MNIFKQDPAIIKTVQDSTLSLKVILTRTPNNRHTPEVQGSSTCLMQQEQVITAQKLMMQPSQVQHLSMLVGASGLSASC